MAVSNCSRTCRNCGTAFIRTEKGQPTKYCGLECRRRKTAVRQISLETKRIRKPRKRNKKRNYRVRPVHCHGCGISSIRKVPRKSSERYCTQECWHRTRTRVASEIGVLQGWADANRRAADLARLALVAPEVKALYRMAAYVERPKTFMATCRCGSSFVARRPHPETVCRACSWEAYRSVRRVAKAKRRAVERGVQADDIDPFVVFERDGWRCLMCGIATPKELRGTYEPNAPELDHIKPIALGGLHTWANVQCACRKCNGLKGATEQMAA